MGVRNEDEDDLTRSSTDETDLTDEKGEHATPPESDK